MAEEQKTWGSLRTLRFSVLQLLRANWISAGKGKVYEKLKLIILQSLPTWRSMIWTVPFSPLVEV